MAASKPQAATAPPYRGQRPSRQPHSIYTAEEVRWAILFLLPTVGSVLVFTVFPVIFSFVISLLEWNAVQPPKFVGLNNYRNLLTDAEFIRSVRNTLQFVIGYVPGILVSSLLIAFLLSREIRFHRVYRAIFFFPSIVSIIVLSEIWLWIYEPRYGLINYYLSKVGFSGAIGWLSDPKLAMWAIVIMSVWAAMGYYMVLYLAGLLGIDQTLYEAAEMDGANTFSQFWYITLPLLTPVTFLMVTMLVIGSFQVFGQVYVMTQGGPLHATDVVIYTIYNNAFGRFLMGRASAQAYVVGLMMFVVTVIQWRFWGRTSLSE
jgi:multiple sugar transport system permease protein